jgi:hypothetical protein
MAHWATERLAYMAAAYKKAIVNINYTIGFLPHARIRTKHLWWLG